MKKSRKVILAAILILLIAQFFDYGSESTYGSIFNWALRERRFETHYYNINGWVRNSWFDAAIPIFLYIFYKAERKTWVYFLGFCFIVLLGWAGEFGGTLGLISIIIAAYSIYLRIKEPKSTGAKPAA